jgi:leucyl/phenylalanyl-tRNA--protein transferase
MTNPSFPYLNELCTYSFPPVEDATPEGVLAVGGNLSPGMLLSAYSQGIFPWYTDGEPILWWSPDPRFVLFPDELHVSKSMKKALRKGGFNYSLDRCFEQIIRGCRTVPRHDQNGTWITGEMLEAYTELHHLGYAHSIEVWREGQLAGGMYGVSLGCCFFGESMYSLVPNASKAALIRFIGLMRSKGFTMLDCQVHSEHLSTLGARMIPRREFMRLLKSGLGNETYRGNWGTSFRNFQ